MGMRRFLIVVAIALAGCGGSVPYANAPTAGDAWFGKSFDTTTFEVSGRVTAVSTSETFVMVARTPRQLDASQLVLRVYVDDELVSNAAVTFDGSGDVWGFNLGPLGLAGTWKYELADVGGNVLASGTVTAN